MSSGASRGLGLLVLLAWLLHARTKLELGVLPEMLWACHVTALLVAAGLIARIPWLAAVGFLFQVAVGLPSFVIDAILRGDTTVTSIIVHLLSPLAAWRMIRRTGWPRWVPLAALAVYLVLLVVSRLFTPPALNINLAHEPWGPCRDIYPGIWASWLAAFAIMSVLLFAVDGVARRRLILPCCAE